MFILCHAAKNEPRKRAKGCRLWKPLHPTRGSRVGVFVQARGWQEFFANCAAGMARHNAARCALCYFFLIQERSNQESRAGI
jgi:hypothetical protein